MLADAKYLLAQLALAALGGGVAFHPVVRQMSAASRAALSLAAGAVALTLEATLFSILDLSWSLAGLGGPLLGVSLLLAWKWSRQPTPSRAPLRFSLWVALVAGLSALIGLGYCVVSFVSSSATSMDYLFFWGVKSVRYAAHRGIDADFLRGPFTAHAVPDYPPLVPIVQGWGCLAAGRMPWRVVPVLSAVWLAAAIPIVFERCRRFLLDDAAAAVTSFWTVALSVSLVSSYSGGNAEVPLLFFETVALVWLLTEREAGESRLVPLLALCGAALTKVEGSLAVALIAAGTLVSSQALGWARSLRRVLVLVALPAAAVGTWFLYQWSKSLRVGYRSHGALLELHPEHLPGLLSLMLRSLHAGSGWLPWIVPILLLLAFPSAWRRVAPALTLVAGLLLFLSFDYLHDADMPRIRIEWTLPRVSQPALSAVILAAGLASLQQRAGARELRE